MKRLEAIPFEMEKHYPTVALWWEAHGQHAVPAECLPRIGFFVPSTCAGFLYQTDSKIALIEGLISSPESDPSYRDQALDAVVEALCAEAKKLGFVGIQGFTKVKRVSARASRLGFQAHPSAFTLVSRRL
jgi:hypothetical protein